MSIMRKMESVFSWLFQKNCRLCSI